MSEERIIDKTVQEEIASAKEARRQEIAQVFDPNRMKVIRKELFANLRDPAVTIRNGSITFNTACINGLEDVVYVKLMVDEEQGFLSVTACDENDKEALRWCVAKPDKRKSRKMRCPDFTDYIYDLMKWDKKCRYKILGYQVPFEGDIYYVFDLNVKKVFNEKPKKGEEELDGNGDPVSVDTRTGYYSDDIANTFCVPMDQHKRETEVTNMDGYVNIAMLTGPREAGGHQEQVEDQQKLPQPDI